MRRTKVKKENETKMKENGITLIALVVTIIVLIILAGITISILTGDNAIINNAKEAVLATEIAQFEEKVTMAQASLQTQITKKSSIEKEYIATSNENFEKIVEDVAKDFDLPAEDIITVSRKKYQVASTESVINKLQIATIGETIKKDGYTISSSLDIVGNSQTEGHGYITIWYTSNKLRYGLEKIK